jgi:glucose-1-phosphatase
MINAIIFDLGDIFINLEIERSRKAFQNLGLNVFDENLQNLNNDYETGKISENDFLHGIQSKIPNASLEEIKLAWNQIIGDFPLYRLEFLQNLKGKYRLFLLTNTDKTHIEFFEEQVGVSFFSDFYQCFDKVYYSYEMKMRKPDEALFAKILGHQNLQPKRTLFIDDKIENTNAAAFLGIQTWNLQVGKEDVVDLFDKKIL